MFCTRKKICVETWKPLAPLEMTFKTSGNEAGSAKGSWNIETFKLYIFPTSFPLNIPSPKVSRLAAVNLLGWVMGHAIIQVIHPPPKPSKSASVLSNPWWYGSALSLVKIWAERWTSSYKWLGGHKTPLVRVKDNNGYLFISTYFGVNKTRVTWQLPIYCRTFFGVP